MDPWAAAQANVAAKYDPQEANLNRQIDLAKQNTLSGEQAIQGFGNTGRGIINSTYDTLYGLLGQQRQQQGVDLGAQAALTDRGYDQALANIGAQSQASQDWIQQMQQNTGTMGYNASKNTQLQDIIGSLKGQGEYAKATFGGNFRDWTAKMDALAGAGIGQAHQAQALRSTEFESQLLKQLGENRLAGTTQETDMMNKLGDLLGAKGSDLIDMYNTLAEQEWQHEMEQAKLNEQASEASAALQNARDIAAMQESGANSRAAGASDNSLGWAQLAELRSKNASDAALSDKELNLKYANQPPAGMTQSDWAKQIGSDPRYLGHPELLAHDSDALARGDFSSWAPQPAAVKTPSKGINFKGAGTQFLAGAGQAAFSPASALYSWLR